MHSFRGFFAVGFCLTLGAVGTSCSGEEGKGKDPVEAGGRSGSTGAGGADAGPAAGGSEAAGGAMAPDAGPEAGAGGAAPIPTNCGNGQLEANEGELCDDGDQDNQNGCTVACKFTCTKGTDEGYCNNGNFCDGPENCDDDHKCLPSPGPMADGAICGQAHRCKAGLCERAEAVCNDELVVRPEEECDDRNTDPDDGCNNCKYTCKSDDPTRDCRNDDPSCDGNLACDDQTHRCKGLHAPDLTPCGVGGEDKACVNGVCSSEYCGNRTREAGEECDDGNRIDGDGCDRCRFSCAPSDPTRDCRATNECYEDGTCNTGTNKCPAPVVKVKGTACDNGTKNCVAGNCVNPLCGDGIIAIGIEACDDGNVVETDGCRRTCGTECTTAAADCRTPGGNPDAPACRRPVCDGPSCSTEADPAQEDAVCNTGAGSGRCKSGACSSTNGSCGNGTKEGGEQCDKGTGNGPNTGCEIDCRLSCQQDSDCSDGDPCTGTEACNTATNVCNAGANPPADGSSCGSGRICLQQGCRLSVCGDNHTNRAAGEECDPPNVGACDSQCKALEQCDLGGKWAMKVVANVSWGDAAGVLEPDTGDIVQWALVDVTQTDTNLAATIRPCGLTIPDFQATAVVGSDWFGLEFPNASFDSAQIASAPVTGLLNHLAPGATVQLFESAILIGLTMPNPFAPWPATQGELRVEPGVTLDDVDGDGKVGFTVNAKQGARPDGAANYSNIIVNIDGFPTTPPGRADKMMLAVRQVVESQTGTLTTCTSISGTAQIREANVHVIDCHRDTGVDCAESEYNLADGVRPIHTVTGANFEAAKLTGADTSCAAVRAAVP